MMARRRTQYIELDGPLFDDDVTRRFHDAVAKGMEEMANDGASILGAAISQRGFVKTGRFLRSIDTLSKRSDKDNSAGYTAVVVTDAYPEKGRPTRTWFERGTRRGVRLRTGGYGFRKAATALRQVDWEQYFGGRIASALNG